MNRFIACTLLCLSVLLGTIGTAQAQHGRRHYYHRHHRRPLPPPPPHRPYRR